MTFKLTSNKKHRYIKFNHTRYFAFKLSNLPKNFAEITSEAPVNSWLTYKGYTLINESLLSDTYTLR